MKQKIQIEVGPHKRKTSFWQVYRRSRNGAVQESCRKGEANGDNGALAATASCIRIPSGAHLPAFKHFIQAGESHYLHKEAMQAVRRGRKMFPVWLAQGRHHPPSTLHGVFSHPLRTNFTFLTFVMCCAGPVVIFFFFCVYLWNEFCST